MPNKRYIAGTAFEYRVRDVLRALGLETIRAAGSHGGIDIAAGDGSLRWGIQCKRDGAMSPGDKIKLRKACEAFGFEPMVAYMCDRFLYINRVDGRRLGHTVRSWMNKSKDIFIEYEDTIIITAKKEKK